MGCASSSEVPVTTQSSPSKPLVSGRKDGGATVVEKQLCIAPTSDDSNDLSGNKLLSARVELSRVSDSRPPAHDDHPKHKERRAAAGTEAVRDQIRKLAVGGPSDKAAVYEVSDSEDDEDEWDMTFDVGWDKPPEVREKLCMALQESFVFQGISESVLAEVVDRMHGMSFPKGKTVLRQGDIPKSDDCMYYLEVGDAQVVITGADTKVFDQKPGWLFGDVALLFNSARSASVVAKTNMTVWALDRTTFLRFVMKHAQGARALRFLRKLPLLKGLSDNDLIAAASRMPQRTYKDGEALVNMGERGDELYLIRYGKVRVLRPDGNGGQVEVVKLARGQFVGERAVINNKLRSADCVAHGDVQVVVMKKRDFMDLDNPLLASMMDYDAVSTCVRSVSFLKGLQTEQQEQLLDVFDSREDAAEGTTVVQQGDVVDCLRVLKLGEAKLFQDGHPVSDPDFLREVAGFQFFGEAGLQTPFRCPYTVVAASETVKMLKLTKTAFDAFLGIGTGLSKDAIMAAMQRIPGLSSAGEAELEAVLGRTEERSYVTGDVISDPSGSLPRFYLVKAGEVALVAPELALPGQLDLGSLVESGRLLPGDVYSDDLGMCSVSSSSNSSSNSGRSAGPGAFTGVKASLVAATHGTSVIALAAHELEQIMARSRAVKNSCVRYSDLEMHRIIGTGQFGLVRLVRSRTDNNVFALKAMHKAPIAEGKQIEHVLNERRILQLADSSFCVQMRGAYQDERCLYLLQEWVPGGELFHLLDLEGAFDERASMFYAANVLLAFEFLHSQGIIYRDLKPENLLLDGDGYLKMADFGFAKHIGNDKTHTICGTPDYQAPEVIMRRGTNKAADYWGLGVLIFEMLVGDPPFKSLSGDPWDTFRQALSGRFYVPNFISDAAADIIFKLLQVNPEKRLGSGPGGAAEIKKHVFFSGIDWAALEARTFPAPMRPRVRNPLDTSNFDNFDDCDIAPPKLTPEVAAKQPGWEEWEWI